VASGTAAPAAAAAVARAAALLRARFSAALLGAAAAASCPFSAACSMHSMPFSSIMDPDKLQE
jgi:hypothetical protein